MKIQKTIGLIIFLSCSFSNTTFAQDDNKSFNPDVLSYKTSLELNIKENYIQGSVDISFLIDSNATKVAFNCGNLQIINISGETVLNFEQKDKKVIISLKYRRKNENKIRITYTGSPTRGILFFPKAEEVYTVYFTSEWMVCNDSPNDRAKFKIDLLIPQDKTCVASGILTQKVIKGDRIQYSWARIMKLLPILTGLL